VRGDLQLWPLWREPAEAELELVDDLQRRTMLGFGEMKQLLE